MQPTLCVFARMSTILLRIYVLANTANTIGYIYLHIKVPIYESTHLISSSILHGSQLRRIKVYGSLVWRQREFVKAELNIRIISKDSLFIIVYLVLSHNTSMEKVIARKL